MLRKNINSRTIGAFVVEMATEKLKDTNHQGLTKLQQN
jgi:hypothetical protein